MGQIPVITYPEGAIDVSDAANALRLHGRDGIPIAFEALERIEKDDRAVLVIYAGTSHERLLTPHGRVMLLGATYMWWVGKQQTHPAVIAERHPYLADYVATRTAAFIAELERDIKFETDANRRFIEVELGRLRYELDQVRAPSSQPH